MAVSSSFVLITPENLKTIAEKLSRKEGRILIAEPGPGSYQEVVDVLLHLFAHPLINVKEAWFYTQRGSKKKGKETWQTNWEDDREYFLRSRPRPSEDSVVNFCRELFERMRVGDYELSIGFQAQVGGGVFSEKGLSLYVMPGDEALKQALVFGLKHVIGQMQKQNRILLLGAVEKMADYAIKDLKENKIFRANVSAGVEADIISG